MWKELVKKIELQSILVLFATLGFGYLLLNLNEDIKSVPGWLGLASISMGLLYTFGSFFSNQIKENYTDVIIQYKSIISMLKSGHKDITKDYKEHVNIGLKSKKYKDYSEEKTETQSE